MLRKYSEKVNVIEFDQHIVSRDYKRRRELFFLCFQYTITTANVVYNKVF